MKTQTFADQLRQITYAQLVDALQKTNLETQMGVDKGMFNHHYRTVLLRRLGIAGPVTLAMLDELGPVCINCRKKGFVGTRRGKGWYVNEKHQARWQQWRTEPIL